MNKKASKVSTYVALALTVQAALYIIISIALSGFEIDKTGAPRFIILSAFSVAINLIPALIIKAFSKPQERESGANVRIRPSSERADAVVFAAGCAALVFAVGIVYEYIFPDAAADIPVSKETPLIMHVLMVFSLCVVPAVCEEIFFRGCVAKQFAVAGKTAAVIMSSLSFALAHFSGQIFPYAFMAGLVFGALYFKTQSIKYSIGAHFFCNFTSYMFACAKMVMPLGAYRTFECVTVVMFIGIAIATSIIVSKSFPSGKNSEESKADATAIITPALAAYIVAATIIVII